jgi:tetratricopeptide (TPR) repeat protein
VHPIKQFIHEVHRRSLWQVLGIFLASSWGVLQAVEFLTDFAGLPDWTPAMALVLLMIGLPICLATAFVQEGMPGHGDHDRPADEGFEDRAAEPTSASGDGGDDNSVAVATVERSLPVQASGTRSLLTWRNAVMGGIGAFALLGFSLIAYFVMWTTGVGPVGSLVAQGVIDERDPVLLAEFDNRTSDEMLGSVVTDALRVDLLESQVVTLVDDRLVSETLGRMGRDPTAVLTDEVAREVAIREGIKAVIEGDVSGVGSGYLLSVEIVAPQDGETLAAFRETAESDSELLPAIDRLSQKLRERAGESLRDIRAEEPLESVTTSSLDALRLFAAGNAAADQGDEPAAIRLLNEAVALDSTFAMAWRKLAVLHGNLGGNEAEMRRAATAAYEHRERLTERERYLAEAYYHARVTLDFDAQADAYRRVLELQPDEPTALNNLGVYYSGRRDFARARDLYVRAAEGPGRTRNSFNNLTIALYNLGEKEQALATARQGIDLYPVDPGLRQREMRVLWGLGRHEEAIRIGRAIMADFPDAELDHLSVLSDVAAIESTRGRLAASRAATEERRALAAAADRPGSVFFSEVGLAYLDLAEGADSSAVAQRLEDRFEEIFAGVPEVNRPYGDMAGLWATIGRDARRTRQWADRALEQFPPQAVGSPFYEEVVLTIDGFMGAVAGDWELTVTSLREVARRQNNCTDCFLDILGEAFDQLQQPDTAIVYLEQFLELDLFDLIDEREGQAADRLVQLAGLYEEVGRSEDAAAAWTRFADRWADADAILQPRVAAARANAARLAPGGD